MSGENSAKTKLVNFKQTWVENTIPPEECVPAIENHTVALDDVITAFHPYGSIKETIAALSAAQRNIPLSSHGAEQRIHEAVSMMENIQYSDGFKLSMQDIAQSAAKKIFEEIGFISISANDWDGKEEDKNLRRDVSYMTATIEQKHTILEAVSRIYTDEAKRYFDWIKPVPVIINENPRQAFAPVDIDDLAQKIFTPVMMQGQEMDGDNFYIAVENITQKLTNNITQQIAAGYLAKEKGVNNKYARDADIVLESAVQQYTPSPAIPQLWERHPQTILATINGKIAAVHLSFYMDAKNPEGLNELLADATSLIVKVGSFSSLPSTQHKTYENIISGLSNEAMTMRKKAWDQKYLTEITAKRPLFGSLTFHR